MAEYDIPKLTEGKLVPGVLPDDTNPADLEDLPDGATRLAMTSAERAKLSGVATGAEVNVNADWDAVGGDAQILNKPSTMPPAAHWHVLADISDYAPPDLSGLVEINDPRLSDARAPTAHYHSIGGVDGLQAALDGKQAAGSYAAASHGHTLDDATDTATRVAMTPAERTKLEGIAAGAEVNVNADWNANSGDAQIFNKPTIPSPPPDASTTTKGVVQLAGDLGGTAAAPTVRQSTETVAGKIELATAAETTTGTDTTRAVTPARLKTELDKRALASHNHNAGDLSGVVKTINGSPPDGSGNATVSTGSGAPPDATASVKGAVQLAGDLGGTASAPTVPGLAGKANTSHTHAAADIGSGTFAIARIPTGTTSSTVALGNHTHTAAAVGAAPAGHEHLAGQVLQPLNYQTGSSYTLVYADIGKLIRCASSSPFTLTVPNGVFSAGQRVDVMQGGAGAVTVVGSGVTLLAPPGMTLVSEGQNALFTILFVSPTVAVVAGWMARA